MPGQRRDQSDMDEDDSSSQVNSRPGPSRRSQRALSSSSSSSSASSTGGGVEQQRRNNIPLAQVFPYLNPTDLMECRHVNREWNQLAAGELRERAVFPLRFKFDRTSGTFVEGCDWKIPPDSVRPLQSLIEVLQNPHSQFPGSEFYFEGENLAAPNVQQFFELFGGQIRTLHVRREPMANGKFSKYDNTNKHILRRLFTQQVTQLEYLELGYFETVWNEDEKIDFPFLKELICAFPKSLQFSPKYPPKSTAFAMLGEAPNLEKVKNFKVDYVDWFIDNDKMDTINEYNFEL